MAVWYKLGVRGDLITEAQEGFRKTVKLYSKRGEDVYVTSLREGTHLPYSFHYSGRAWDQRPGRVAKEELRQYLGPDFQVIDHGTGANFHRHIEYEPKKDRPCQK